MPSPAQIPPHTPAHTQPGDPFNQLPEGLLSHLLNFLCVGNTESEPSPLNLLSTCRTLRSSSEINHVEGIRETVNGLPQANLIRIAKAPKHPYTNLAISKLAEQTAQLTDPNRLM